MTEQTEQTAEEVIPPQKDKTRPELLKLAEDIVAGRVFGSWMIRRRYYDGQYDIDPSMIFFPLIFGAKLPPNVGQLYEYMSESGPRSVNGYPIFFSCHILTTGEVPILRDMIATIEKAKTVMQLRELLKGQPLHKRLWGRVLLLFWQCRTDPKKEAPRALIDMLFPPKPAMKEDEDEDDGGDDRDEADDDQGAVAGAAGDRDGSGDGSSQRDAPRAGA